MLEGSHFGNWDVADNVMRSTLATPEMGLAVCCIAGHPHWFVHHMALGETIGYGTRLSMNNSTLYQTWSNTLPRAIYITLLGDPSLRMDPVAAASNLKAQPGAGGINLTWSPSPDTVAGYHVYRSVSASGPFIRLSDSLITGTTFTDPATPGGAFPYMVRAVALQTNSSGTYFNPGQGVFAGTGSSTPIILHASIGPGGLQLNWNSTPGTVYRLLSASDLSRQTWSDVSGPISASGTSTTWTIDNTGLSPAAFYRVSTP
jgi:hypothetical protein